MGMHDDLLIMDKNGVWDFHGTQEDKGRWKVFLSFFFFFFF